MGDHHEARIARDYVPGHHRRVRQTCVEIMMCLGDFRDEIRVVGGLVPSLIVDHRTPGQGDEAHIGTLDLDLGFSVVVLNERCYEAIVRRLRSAGFTPDANLAGNVTSQRWLSAGGVTVDFLIPPSQADDKGGRLRNLQQGFAAIITPGLDLAFCDFETVDLQETMPVTDAEATRRINVCGAGAFTVLKALAFDKRGKPKDAYDMYYVLWRHPEGVTKIAERIRSFGPRREVNDAIKVLRRDFESSELPGPASVALFLGRSSDDNLRADVAGVVRELLLELKGES